MKKKLTEEEINLLYKKQHPDYILIEEDENWDGCDTKIKIYKCHSDGLYWKLNMWIDSWDIVRKNRELTQVVEKRVTHMVWSEDVTSKQFITLEQFLLLGEQPGIPHDRPLNMLDCSYKWVERYKVAKKSYEKYGEDGPPVGSIVKTLIGGYGGNGGQKRIFNGVSESDNRFFVLTEKDKDQPYLCNRSCWWRDFVVLSEGKENES